MCHSSAQGRNVTYVLPIECHVMMVERSMSIYVKGIVQYEQTCLPLEMTRGHLNRSPGVRSD